MKTKIVVLKLSKYFENSEFFLHEREGIQKLDREFAKSRICKIANFEEYLNFTLCFAGGMPNASASNSHNLSLDI